MTEVRNVLVLKVKTHIECRKILQFTHNVRDLSD